MRMWWQGMVIVLEEAILRTGRAGAAAGAIEAEMGALGAGAGADARDAIGADARDAMGADATETDDLAGAEGEEWMRTTLSTGAPD